MICTIECFIGVLLVQMTCSNTDRVTLPHTFSSEAKVGEYVK